MFFYFLCFWLLSSLRINGKNCLPFTSIDKISLFFVWLFTSMKKISHSLSFLFFFGYCLPLASIEKIIFPSRRWKNLSFFVPSQGKRLSSLHINGKIISFSFSFFFLTFVFPSHQSKKYLLTIVFPLQWKKLSSLRIHGKQGYCLPLTWMGKNVLSLFTLTIFLGLCLFL